MNQVSGLDDVSVRRANVWITITIWAGLMVALVAALFVTTGSSKLLPFLAVPGTTDIHITEPGGAASGTPLPLSSFADAQAALGSGDLRLEWPGADSLGAHTVSNASVEVVTGEQAIVFEGSINVDGTAFAGMVILDWTPPAPTPTISLGLKGTIDVADLNSSWGIEGGQFVLDGYLGIATGDQDLTNLGVTSFYGDLPALSAGIEIEGGMTLDDLLPGLGDGASVAVTVAASLDADIAAVLTTSQYEPADPGAVSFTGTLSADDLSLPSVPGLSATSFEIALDLTGSGADQEFEVSATGSLTIDDDSVASAPVTFDATFSTDGTAFSLNGGLADGATWSDPFGISGITVSSLRLGLDAPGGGTTPTLTLAGNTSIGGVGVSATIEADDELSVALDIDEVKVSQLVTMFSDVGVGTSGLSLDSELGDLSVGPTSLVLSTDAGHLTGALSTGISFRGYDATMLLAGSTEPGAGLLAAVQLPATTVGKLAPGAPGALAAIPLPGGGFIVSTDAVDKSDFEPGGISDTYLSETFCGDTVLPADCDFTIPSGLSLAAQIELDDGIREALGVILPIADEPVRVDGVIPIFEPGDVSITVRLPAMSPDASDPDQKGTAEWLDEARLSIEMTSTGTDFTVKLVGELDTLLPDETEPDGIDEVTFTVDAELSLGTSGVTITIGAAAGPWDTPFGVDWVDLNGLRLELVITVAPTPGVQVGIAASATLKSACEAFGGTSCPPPSTFEAAFAIGVTVGSPVKVDFGLRIFADAITLKDVAAIAKEMGADVDPDSLPDASLRNVEFAFSTVDAPSLCLKRGLVVGADVYLDSPMASSGPGTEVDRGLCSDTSISPAEGIASCAADSACFAHLRLDVSDDGIFASAALGMVDLSPVKVHGASVSLTLTPTQQVFEISGSVSIEGYISADGSLSISSTGFSFSLSTSDTAGNKVTIAGSAGLNPDEAGFAFSLKIFVRLPGLDTAVQDVQGAVSWLKEAFTGEPLATTYSLRCIELNLELVTGISQPISGEIAARVHYSAIDTATDFEDGRVWSLEWDFDALVTTNVAGMVASLNGDTAVDEVGCGYEPDSPSLTVEGQGPGATVFFDPLDGNPAIVDIDASWVSRDFATYYVEIVSEALGGTDRTFARRYSPGEAITFSVDAVHFPIAFDRTHDDTSATATLYQVGTEGSVAVDTITMPYTVVYPAISDFTLTPLGNPSEGDLVTLTASWKSPISTLVPSMTSEFTYWYAPTGAANPSGTDTQVFLSEPPATFPQTGPFEHTVDIQLPAKCACELQVRYKLTDGQYTYEYEYLTVEVEHTVPQITNIDVDGVTSDPVVIGPASTLNIEYTEPGATGTENYSITINGRSWVTTRTSPTTLSAPVGSYPLLYDEEGGTAEWSIQVGPVTNDQRALSNPVVVDIEFAPENSDSGSPVYAWLGGGTPTSVTVSGTTRNPTALDDTPDPFGSADCGAVWYEPLVTNNLTAHLSTVGSRTIESRADGGTGQELAIAVYEDGVLLAEIAPDGDPSTTSYPQELSFFMDSGSDYLIGVAPSDTAAGCPADPTVTGPISLSLTTSGVAPVQDDGDSLVQSPDVDQYLLEEPVNFDNPSVWTDLDDATSGEDDAELFTLPGFGDCFDDDLEQTLVYLLGNGAEIANGQEVDVIVPAEYGDVQLAVISGTVDISGPEPVSDLSLAGCSEDGPTPWVTGGTPAPPVVSYTFDVAKPWNIVLIDTNGRQSARVRPIVTGRGSTPYAPIPLDLGAPTQTHSTSLSSSEFGVQSLPCTSMDIVHNHWFTWTAETADEVDIGAPLGASDVALAAFPLSAINGSATIDPADAVACTDVPGSAPETLRLNPSEGETYMIVVGSAAIDADTVFEIDLTLRADKTVNDVRIPASAFPYRGSLSNVGATSDGDNSSCVGTDFASVWLGFDLPADLDVDIDTFGSDFDTTLVVSDIAQEVGCNDDAEGTLQSRVRAAVTANTGGSGIFADQYVRIDGYNGAQGRIQFNLTTRGDDIVNAVEITDLETPSTLNTAYATVEPNERWGGCHYEGDSLNGSVWWKWVAPQSGRFDVELTGFDTQLTVFDGNGGAPGDVIGCGEDELPGFAAADRIGVLTGDIVYFQADGWQTTTGDATIEIAFTGIGDTDADTVFDDVDNCVSVPNTDQANTDGAADGGDACDDDDDNDTVNDIDDNCPVDANTDQADTDDDGIGDVCDPSPFPNDVFTSVDPGRFADTRPPGETIDGQYEADGANPAGTSYEVQIAGRGDVPPDATAAVINLTTVVADAPGHATVYPCTPTVPNSSAVNYNPGGVDPNEVIAKLSPTGSICIYTHATVHLLVDVVGYTTTTAPYTAIEPTRYADSRPQNTFDNQYRDTGKIDGGTFWKIPIAGRGPIPASATTAVLNVTAVVPDGPGHITVFPCTATVPTASSLNYTAGMVRPNEVVAKLSATGHICIYTHANSHLIVDAVGYIENVPGYTPIDPTRYADSRPQDTFDNQYRDRGPNPAGTSWEIPIAGRGDIPANATTATLNVTVVLPDTFGHATVYPCTTTVPNASSLNYQPGDVRATEVIAKLSPTGTICIYTHANTHLIVDATGHNGTP